MEFKSILIKDTTVEERKQIVKESLGNISASCDGCMARLSEMYDEYIEGKKEIRDSNREFNGHYLRGDRDKGKRRSCPMVSTSTPLLTFTQDLLIEWRCLYEI